MEDTFIVSGGWDSPDGDPVNNVVVHKENGVVKFLPGLIQGRASHACASYFNEYEQRVICTKTLYIMLNQILGSHCDWRCHFCQIP